MLAGQMNVLSFYSSTLFINASHNATSLSDFQPIWTKIKWFNFCQYSQNAVHGASLTASQAMGLPASSSLCQPTDTSTLVAVDSSFCSPSAG